jgi:hypothetical protein
MLSRNVSPRLVVEAIVFDERGTPVAAMVTSEKAALGGGHHSQGGGLYEVNGMVDKVTAGLHSELMNPR